MFENLVEILKANPHKIVYTEGTDARILESASRLKKVWSSITVCARSQAGRRRAFSTRRSSTSHWA